MSQSSDFEGRDLGEKQRIVSVVVAKSVAEQMQRSGALASQQHAEMAKWLLASLLAINSGGELATLSAIREGAAVYPAIWFTLGIMLALLSGVTIQLVAVKFIDLANEAEMYWLGVDHTAERVSEKEIDWQGRTDRWRRIGWVAPVSGWLSAVAFLVGAGQLTRTVDTQPATRTIAASPSPQPSSASAPAPRPPR